METEAVMHFIRGGFCVAILQRRGRGIMTKVIMQAIESILDGTDASGLHGRLWTLCRISWLLFYPIKAEMEAVVVHHWIP